MMFWIDLAGQIYQVSKLLKWEERCMWREAHNVREVSLIIELVNKIKKRINPQKVVELSPWYSYVDILEPL